MPPGPTSSAGSDAPTTRLLPNDTALALVGNAAERRFLQARRAELDT